MLLMGTGIDSDSDDEDISFCFGQSHAGVPDMWMRLDSQSTVDVFCNLKLLKSIQEVNRSMTIKCNAGMITIK